MMEWVYLAISVVLGALLVTWAKIESRNVLDMVERHDRERAERKLHPR